MKHGHAAPVDRPVKFHTVWQAEKYSRKSGRKYCLELVFSKPGLEASNLVWYYDVARMRLVTTEPM